MDDLDAPADPRHRLPALAVVGAVAAAAPVSRVAALRSVAIPIAAR